MHDYAVFGHNRATIGRWLGISSIVLTGAISSFISYIYQLTGFQAVTSVAITTGLIYFVLHLLFNKFAWKIPMFQIPDLNGIWKVKGTTLDEDGNAKYEWDAEIDIEQTWEKMVVCLKTSQSASESYTATLAKANGTRGGWLLSYSYNNNPNVDQYHELNSHKGYCEILLDKKLKIGSAAYFNSNGRRTFGKMALSKD
ncbi:Cap15 family CBASS effector [Aliivibrio sp. A6]|uniref:Cap15 family cyclic dinucleotide receptor domain-containing protein n=1 Tax=Aliivibrio sp. A6 TaxID=3028427 RepID=UPI0023799E66|nr:pancortin-3 [Aliivibrio sp. A6]MDD9177453.1 pancortin-3 [Aliivibrio sp. A6]